MGSRAQSLRWWGSPKDHIVKKKPNVSLMLTDGRGV